MPKQALITAIKEADKAITSKDFDRLMNFYTDDAILVVRPNMLVSGKAAIKKAFRAISEHFGHGLQVTQGNMEILPTGDTALVIMETILQDSEGTPFETRRATYVFKKSIEGDWLCAVDNSYGTNILDGSN